MTSVSEDFPAAARFSRSRWLSAGEVLLGAFIVLGHNVFRILPNEVPILFAIGMISARLRNGSWSALGLRFPSSWTRTILIALTAAAVRILLGQFVVDPITSHFWPPAIAPEGVEAITGNVRVALQWLALVWTFAAFGEEISYRGYLLTRTAELGGRTKAAYWLAVVLASVLFGFGHFYKGPAGIVDSGVAGLVLGATFMLSGRNLWACILAHGFIDTVGVVFLFFGWGS